MLEHPVATSLRARPGDLEQSTRLHGKSFAAIKLLWLRTALLGPCGSRNSFTDLEDRPGLQLADASHWQRLSAATVEHLRRNYWGNTSARTRLAPTDVASEVEQTHSTLASEAAHENEPRLLLSCLVVGMRACER